MDKQYISYLISAYLGLVVLAPVLFLALVMGTGRKKKDDNEG